MSEMSETVRDRMGSVVDAVADTIHEVVPHLRGWLHLVTAPLTLAAGIVLICLAPAGAPRWGAVAFSLGAFLLFTVSAVYHRLYASGRSNERLHALLQRWDHANIMLMIAGTYTPFSLILLHGASQVILLSVVWTGAIAGVFFRIFWTSAPRWLYVPIYIALGWAAIFFIPAFFTGAEALGIGIGIAIFVLICTGGALYTIGAVAYGFRRPNPWPHWFGFHEVFHTFTILAFITHYTGVSLATYALR